MEIKKINNIRTSFTSLKNPIPAEIFNTELGKISMYEALPQDIKEVAKIIRKNETLSYKIKNCYGNREYTAEARKIYRSINKSQWLKDIKDYLIKIINKPDGKTSVLVAKNENDKIIGFASLQSIDKAKDSQGVIEHLHLDNNYGKGKLNVYLLDKITKSGYGQFKDIYVPCIGVSVHNNSLKTLGYKIIPEKSSVSNFLNREYGDSYFNHTWARKEL